MCSSGRVVRENRDGRRHRRAERASWPAVGKSHSRCPRTRIGRNAAADAVDQPL